MLYFKISGLWKFLEKRRECDGMIGGKKNVRFRQEDGGGRESRQRRRRQQQRKEREKGKNVKGTGL
jgi:hypothetical protein